MARVLIAEDIPSRRGALEKALRGAGYHVTSAEDGREAWEIIQNTSFDILVTDIVMPRLCGERLIELVRCHDEIKELPIVIQSSMGPDYLENVLYLKPISYVWKGDGIDAVVQATHAFVSP